MIKTIFKKLLKASGKNYEIDPQIPSKFIFQMLSDRFWMLFRGFLKTGKKVYIGRHTVIYNKSNITFGHHVAIEKHCVIDGFSSGKLVFGNFAKIGAYSKIFSTAHPSKYGVGLKMGDHSAVGQFSEFGAAGGIEIGNDVIMGSYVSFHSENHNFLDQSKLIREQGVTSKGIKIGNNVWVGAKVTFLDGCQVGNHCVVAAGAVVNGNYPDNSIIGGVPAKVLKTI